MIVLISKHEINNSNQTMSIEFKEETKSKTYPLKIEYPLKINTFLTEICNYHPSIIHSFPIIIYLFFVRVVVTIYLRRDLYAFIYGLATINYRSISISNKKNLID